MAMERERESPSGWKSSGEERDFRERDWGMKGDFLPGNSAELFCQQQQATRTHQPGASHCSALSASIAASARSDRHGYFYAGHVVCARSTPTEGSTVSEYAFERASTVQTMGTEKGQ